MDYDKEHYERMFERILDSISPEEQMLIEQKQYEEYLKEAEAFKEAYKKNVCYICQKPFKTMSKDNPCLHWLLRQCKFKKADLTDIYKKYGFFRIVAFLRWCANEERFLSNINDLNEEKIDGKIISSTIRWKNIEWTFDCSEGDFKGHTTTKNSNYPHYHFQMKISGQSFIKFNDAHLPFTGEDIWKLELIDAGLIQHTFGYQGVGMQYIQDAINTDPELILENMRHTENTDEAVHRIETIIRAVDPKGIPLQLLDEIEDECKRTGKTKAVIARDKLKDIATVSTIISPADSIPDIANRTKTR